MPTKEQIRKAIEANCGGYVGASDWDIEARWRVTPPEIQAEYLASISKPKPKTGKGYPAEALEG